jgi:hypothetical protein
MKHLIYSSFRMALKLPNMPYTLIIIIIIIYFLSVLKEGFTIGQPIFDKALDRMNPLAASQNPLKQIIPTGISQADGVKARLMNQVALNNFNT